MTLEKRFARIMKDLDEVTNDLEGHGYEAYAATLDAAAERIEDVKNIFDGL